MRLLNIKPQRRIAASVNVTVRLVTTTAKCNWIVPTRTILRILLIHHRLSRRHSALHYVLQRASPNHRKVMKAEPCRPIPRKLTANLELLIGILHHANEVAVHLLANNFRWTATRDYASAEKRDRHRVHWATTTKDTIWRAEIVQAVSRE